VSRASNRFGPSSFGPVAVTTRNDYDENVHFGAAVVVDAEGAITDSIGDVELPVYPRSALKPFQASAMVRAGLDLPHRLLAVVAASHSGEQPHLDAVAEILERHDLSVDALANTPDRPYGAAARRTSLAEGIDASALQQNCSGKHAGMLATCRVNGWSIEGYLEATHPLQEAIGVEIDRLAGRATGSITHVGVDGCGAPTHVMPLVDVAQAMRTLAVERSDVPKAMMAAPALVGGTDRDVTLWMEAVPDLAAKEGADGVMVASLADGRAASLKIADGRDDVRRAVTVELLRRLGVDVDGHPTVLDRVRVDVRGHGAVVGACAPLDWP